jgi:hypothetical protein
VQLLTVEGVPQVYDYLQQGNIGAAIQRGEQVLSELAAEQSAAAALAAVALDMVTYLAILQEEVKDDLCQVMDRLANRSAVPAVDWSRNI